MTLGYFLETFLGFEKFAVGNTKGKMGEDWWQVEAEILDEEIKRLSLHAPQSEKSIELLVFNDNHKEWTLFRPWMIQSDGNTLELTHARYVMGQDTVFVRALINGKPPELPLMTVEQLVEIARKRLKQGA